MKRTFYTFCHPLSKGPDLGEIAAYGDSAEAARAANSRDRAEAVECGETNPEYYDKLVLYSITVERVEEPENVFKRKIVSRLPITDGSEEVKLECGHLITRIIPDAAEEMDCAECVNEFVALHRKENSGNRG